MKDQIGKLIEARRSAIENSDLPESVKSMLVRHYELSVEGLKIIAEAGIFKELNDLRVKYVGKSGEITSLMKSLKDVPADKRPLTGKFINELNLKELLKDYNGVIIGASGGAMNMAKKVYCIPEIEGEHKDKSFKKILNGLGLTNINIIPHYKLFEKKVFSDKIRMLEDILLPDSKKISMIALYERKRNRFININNLVNNRSG